MNEKVGLQKPFIGVLNQKQIDFIHIPNNAFKGTRTSNYKTNGIDDTGRPCHLYWPDITFPYGGYVNMVEFGIPGTHKYRKIEQEIRMRHWNINGRVKYSLCYTWDDCEKFLKSIGVTHV